MATTLDELREEYRAERIGPAILDEVRRAVHDVVRRYDPAIYGGSASWDHAEEDVTQGVVVDLLLAEGQLDYIMATALTLDDVRNLLRFQVRRYLTRNRRRTVVDNLLDRAKRLLAKPPYEEVAPGRYGFPGDADPRPPTDAELQAAARAAALVPRVSPPKGERAPVVYTGEALAALVEAVARSLPAGFSPSELGKILEIVLTDWVASFLYEFEDVHRREEERPGPEEEVASRAAMEEIVERCSPEQLLIIRRKLEGASDEDIARELGVSRPTVHAKKQAAFDALRDILGGLGDGPQREAIAMLSMRLATLPPGSLGGADA